MAGFEITTAMVQQFRSNVFPLSQQTKSRLRDAVVEDQIVGESGYLEQLAPDDMVDVTTRHADTVIFPGGWERRRISLTDADWGKLVDREDQLRLLVDPNSAYVKSARSAVGRKIDQRIVNAFFATAFTGHNGTVSAAWPAGPGSGIPAGTVVAVNSWKYGNGSGVAHLTISKLIEARVTLLGKEAIEDGAGNDGDPPEDLYFACSSIQIGDLLATTEATAREFGTTKDEIGALVGGKINKLVGFTFKRMDGVPMPLTTDGNSYRRCAAWAKGGMGLGMSSVGEIVRAAERPDKRYAWQVTASVSCGASRLEEAKLVEVLCSES